VVQSRDGSPPYVEYGAMGAGFVLFISSFLDWFTPKESGLSQLAENAWGVGFFAYTGVELGLLAALFLALRTFRPGAVPPPPARFGSWDLVAGAVAGLGALLILLKLIVGMDVLSLGTGHFKAGVGLWLGLAASLVLTGLCLYGPLAPRFQATRRPSGAGGGPGGPGPVPGPGPYPGPGQGSVPPPPPPPGSTQHGPPSWPE
jgi:hypothetical protein